MFLQQDWAATRLHSLKKDLGSERNLRMSTYVVSINLKCIQVSKNLDCSFLSSSQSWAQTIFFFFFFPECVEGILGMGWAHLFLLNYNSATTPGC